MAGIEDVEALSPTENLENDPKETEKEPTAAEKSERTIRLPLTRIKSLIKMDPEVALASTDAAILIAKATELFVMDISKEAYAFTKDNKRKTMQKKDLDQAVDRVDTFAFLEGTLES